MPTFKRIRTAVIGLLILVAVASLVFRYVEDRDFPTSVYFTIITLTTVGYGDVRPETPEGRIVAVLTIGIGMVLFAILLGGLTEIVVEGQVRKVLGRRRLEKQIAAAKDHFIVCGFGRIGSIVCRELQASGFRFVVIEHAEDAADRAESEGYLVLRADATDDDELENAGIQRAKGLVAVLPSDADNVFIAMSAREMTKKENPRLLIVARGEEERSRRKLLRAGANRVVSPHEIGGIRMAHAILRPYVIDFIEAATRARTEIHMEEIPVREKSLLAGKSLLDSGVRQKFGVIIVAIRKSDGRMAFNPNPQTEIRPGDVLITMGPENHQQQLVEACR